METAHGSTPYEYEPLENPAEQIRLLTFQRMEHPTELHLSITNYSLVERLQRPQFAAISYTWGDEHNLRTIWINGAPLIVRYNC